MNCPIGLDKLTRLWNKFLTWLWWPATKEAIEDKKTKKGSEDSNPRPPVV
ncbi:hypothetical protein ES707_16642 [subsurface metagenome]